MLTIKSGRTGKVWVLPTVVVVGMLLLSACGTQATPQAVTDPTATSAAQATAADSPTDYPTEVPTDAPAADATEATDSNDTPISFKNDVMPILESRCAKCHGGEKTFAKLNLTTYAGLLAGGEKGLSFVAGDAAQSKMIQLVESGKMPKRSAKLLPAQIQVLIDWVNQGALDN